jgi:hypothetical protein
MDDLGDMERLDPERWPESNFARRVLILGTSAYVPVSFIHGGETHDRLLGGPVPSITQPSLSALPAASFWRQLMNAIPIVIFVRGARSALGALREKETSR